LHDVLSDYNVLCVPVLHHGRYIRWGSKTLIFPAPDQGVLWVGSRQAASDAATHGRRAVEDAAEAAYKAGEETVGATQGAAESTWQKIKDTVTGHRVDASYEQLSEAQRLAQDTLEAPQEQAESTWQKIKETVAGWSAVAHCVGS
jgi:hypothetical protein